MARFHIAAALGTATLALLIFLQVASNFGLPELHYLNSKYHDPSSATAFAPHQFPINPSQAPFGDGAQYLLGAGKADITGYKPPCQIRMVLFAKR